MPLASQKDPLLFVIEEGWWFSVGSSFQFLHNDFTWKAQLPSSDFFEERFIHMLENPGKGSNPSSCSVQSLVSKFQRFTTQGQLCSLKHQSSSAINCHFHEA
jgi:hypothetical protein